MSLSPVNEVYAVIHSDRINHKVTTYFIDKIVAIDLMTFDLF